MSYISFIYKSTDLLKNKLLHSKSITLLVNWANMLSDD